MTDTVDSTAVPSRERFGKLPSALRKQARWVRLGATEIPAMLVHPASDWQQPVPLLLWMHGRTVQKEIDPGRFLRLMRAGIGACAIDLPGHGERYDAELQVPERTFDVVQQMVGEIEVVFGALLDDFGAAFDVQRMAIGGMSAGGMAALARLCHIHPFICATVEATTGSWMHQQERKMFRDVPEQEIRRLNPIEHVDTWRPIPFQAFHTRADAWVAYYGQRAFVEALHEKYAAAGVSTDEQMIDFVVFEETGAPYEHAGFGRKSAEAKDRQLAFLKRCLSDPAAE